MNLTFEDFTDKIKSKLGIKQNFIKVQWIVGGYHKSDYSENGRENYEIELEPNFDDLDKILELFWPDIPYLTYKKLVNYLINYHEYDENGYYSNARYAVKSVSLEKLWGFIVLEKKGLIN